MTVANVQITKVLLKRGNTIQNNSYRGVYGELSIDMEANALRIHDGVVAGGNVVSGSGGSGSYANSNVKSYLTSFDGNILPSANVTYSLGSSTRQWKDLWVSNNTIYINSIPLSINNNGNLTINGNEIARGPQGPQGNTGPTGATGSTGPQGIQGNIGATGPQGIQGNTGPAGAQGIQGIQGNVGPQGSAGAQGIQGNTGPTGAQGIQGIQGNVGATGPRGFTGNTGEQGPQGERGLTGNTGAQGTSVTLLGSIDIVANLPMTANAGEGWIVQADGDLYLWNTISSDWNNIGQIVGPQGDAGPQGPRGFTGNVGATGAQGETGPAGAQGAQGIQGNVGPQGAQGIQGNVGPQGNIGPQGPQGIQGNTGPQGIQGIQGNVGPQGERGEAGGSANTGDITFDANEIGVSGNNGEIKIRSADGNDYSQVWQTPQRWEAYVENDDVGDRGAWAWIKADMEGGVNNPEVFIENVPANTGVAQRWTFDAAGNLSIPGNIQSEGSINIDINLSDSTLRRWSFGEDGIFKLPGTLDYKIGESFGGGSLAITSEGSVSIFTNSIEGFKLWSFDADGDLQLPVGGEIRFSYGYIDQDEDVIGNALRISGGNSVVIKTDEDGKTWEFDHRGALRLPIGGDIIDSNGQSVLGSRSYTPDDADNWDSPTVNTVAAALDELAAKVAALQNFEIDGGNANTPAVGELLIDGNGA